MVNYLEYVSGSDQLKEPIEESEKIYIELSIKREEAKMSVNMKKKMFQKIDEKVRSISVLLLMKLRVDMIQHLVFKKEYMDVSEKIQKIRVEEKEIRNIIGEV